MKAYIISFYQQEVSDDELVAYLGTKREILNLMRLLPNTVLIISDRNASFITRLIDKKFPQGYFIVAEYIPYNSDGSLPEEAWDFLNKPRKSRKVNRSIGKKKRAIGAKSSSKKK
ncbi:MAG: hypothetical protein QOJ02_43 [Acidobacteriota bacterium]|jgi:hypothetical protein|nr:hypothetical protein [Acidobacteriota bacterium]